MPYPRVPCPGNGSGVYSSRPPLRDPLTDTPGVRRSGKRYRAYGPGVHGLNAWAGPIYDSEGESCSNRVSSEA